jgi:hypothetical protein
LTASLNKPPQCKENGGGHSDETRFMTPMNPFKNFTNPNDPQICGNASLPRKCRVPKQKHPLWIFLLLLFLIRSQKSAYVQSPIPVIIIIIIIIIIVVVVPTNMGN